MRKKIKIQFILIGLLLAAGLMEVQAQQDPMYTQYMYNTMAVNPGYAGSRGVMNITGLVRQQWLGIDGAPQTQTLVFHSPLTNKNIGLGLSVVKDKIGPINQTMIFGDYSYTIKVNESSKLAFGLKAGVNMIQGELAGLRTTEDNDVAFSQDLENRVNPNFGFGMYYHSDKWYIGASIPQLLENEDDYTNVKQRRHYFLIGGYAWEINDQLTIRPTTLIKATVGSPLSVDITATLILRNKLWIGVTHRWSDSFGVLLGYQLTDQLRAGGAYDYTISDLSGYSNGTFEIMVSYDFYFKKTKLRSPRYF